MATITIQMPDDDARAIEKWASMHRRMLIASTVPAAHNWDFMTVDMEITYVPE